MRAHSERLDAVRGRIAERQALNRLAYESSRLEYLEAHGSVVYRPPALSDVRDAVASLPKREVMPVFAYEQDEATGYPFKTKIIYEQDPMNGWGYDSFSVAGLYQWSGGFPGPGSFPREMFPQLSSSVRTQYGHDAVRVMSRLAAETNPSYAGCLGHLRNYMGSSGMTIDVVSSSDKGLANELQAYVDDMWKLNRLPMRVWDSIWNLFRDGEDALHVVKRPRQRLDWAKEFPKIRSVDTSWIRGPENQLYGPWSMGMLTDWPDDCDEVLAYHLWNAANVHFDVDPSTFMLAQLDGVGSNVKRGLPLAWKIRLELPMIRELVSAIGKGEAARQSVAYFVHHKLADKQAVREALPGLHDDDYNHTSDLFGDMYQSPANEVSGVQHVNKGWEEGPPPSGYAKQGADAFQIMCQLCACATDTPVWFWTGSADAENYASSLVSESPVVKTILHYQGIITDHYQLATESAIRYAIAMGKFPVDSLNTCQVHAALPSPVSRNRKDEQEQDINLLHEELISPQDVCVRHQLDFQEQQDKIKVAKARGWKSSTDKQSEDDGKLSDSAADSAPNPRDEGE